jgi:spermidine/putrescine-binding protein
MWKYKDGIISDISEIPYGAFGFVYEVLHTPSGKKYVGRKQLISVTTKALGKKELAEITDKRASKKKKVQKESDWKTYHGSHSEIKQLIKEGRIEEFERTILEFSFSPKHLTYLETKYLFSLSVLENGDVYFNDNILGKFFRKDIPRYE